MIIKINFTLIFSHITELVKINCKKEMVKKLVKKKRNEMKKTINYFTCSTSIENQTV